MKLVDLKIIDNVSDIVDNIDDQNQAYNEAIKYLHSFDDKKLSDNQYTTVNVIKKYLNKNCHPVKSMENLADDIMKKFFKNICEKIEKKD